jgi:two-component system OmpR family sensor kinase
MEDVQRNGLLRGPTDRSRRSNGSSGGTGLGLAIVAIVSAHHDSVGVSQTRGGGATFALELPQHAHSDATASLDDEEVD